LVCHFCTLFSTHWRLYRTITLFILVARLISDQFFPRQILLLVNILFCKYFLEVLHLFAKCFINLKIYIFFLSFKSDCIITELWNILAEFWRYTTTYVPWNDQTLTMYSNVPKHNCSLQFNTRTTLGNCDSSSTFYNIFLFLVCNLGHLEPIEL